MEVGVVAVSKAMEAVKIDAAPMQHYRIQVSNTKKPMFFYLNLAKRYMKQYNDVELSALGMAIPTVVTIAEILKSNGLAIEKHISTSTVGSKDDTKGRVVQKAKLEILLGKTENFEKLTISAVKVPVTENSNKRTTNTAATALVTENSQELTTNTAAMEPVTENFNKLTNTAAEAPVTENSQELTTNTAAMEPVTENFNKLTNTAAEAPVTENSQESTTNTAAMEPVTENFNKLTNTAAEAPVTKNSQELTTNTAAEASNKASEKKE